MWFPSLPVDRLHRTEIHRRDGAGLDTARPFAVTGERRGAVRLVSLCAAARAAGLAPGLALADARAIRPDLETRTETPDRDRAFLLALHRWAAWVSPWAACDGQDGLILDITGCAHLFGGEAALLAELAARLADLGLAARLGLGDTRGAAWALARHAASLGRPASLPPGTAREGLRDLPLPGLRLPAETVSALHRLGLVRIGDLYPLPRAQLARRFGVDLVRRLDQALGAVQEPVSPARPRAPYSARLTLPEPIGLKADVEAGLARLLAPLCRRLEADRMGARGFRLSAGRTDHVTVTAEIGLARPSRDTALIGRLFGPKLDGLDAGHGIDALRLQALGVEPHTPVQRSGLPSRGALGGTAQDLEDLVGRLGNRIGFERVGRFAPRASHIPERAFAVEPAARSARAEAGTGWGWDPPRPLTLFTPEAVAWPDAPPPGRPAGRLRWRGRELLVAGAVGPERIAPEWWRANPGWGPGPRDYWRVRGADGTRLWLFSTGAEGDGRWFVCGVFG